MVREFLLDKEIADGTNMPFGLRRRGASLQPVLRIGMVRVPAVSHIVGARQAFTAHDVPCMVPAL